MHVRKKKIKLVLFRRLHICGLLFLIASLTASADSRFTFETLSLEEGISHNMVYSIIQDRHGVIWLGSMYGLIRYDGQQYTRYRNDPQDLQSISHNDIITVFEDSQGDLWVGTWGGGLNRFDKKNGTFQRFLASEQDSTAIGDNTIWSVAETNWQGKRKLWFATSRSGVYTAEQDGNGIYHFKPVPITLNGKPLRSIQRLLLDSDSTLWVGSTNGLFAIKEGQGSVAFDKSDQSNQYLSGTFIRTIYEDQSRRLWVGTARNGISILSQGESKRVVHKFFADKQNPASLASNSVNAIAEDMQGQFWIATENGLSTIHAGSLGSSVFINSYHNARQPGTLCSNQIISLCHDVSGMLWIGSYLGGVNRYAPWKNKFELLRHNPYRDDTIPGNEITALMQTHDRHLWVATTEGLSVSEEPYTSSLSKLRFEDHPVNTKYVTKGYAKIRALCETRDQRNGYLSWIASGNRLLRIGPNGKKKVYRHNPENKSSLSYGVINALVEGNEDDLWIATSNGLNRMDIVSGKVQRYLFSATDASSLAHSWTLSLYKDEFDNIWIGTYGGLSRYDAASDNFVNYRHQLNDAQSLPSSYIYAVQQAENGKIWVGTSAGLALLDPENGICETYDLDSGLANDVICGIASLGEESLWLSTHQGVTRFSPADKSIRNFDVHDGLQGNLFTQGVSLTLSDGSILFGGINGINRIPVTPLSEKETRSPIVLNSITVSGNVHWLSQDEELRLSWDQREPEFNYALLDYTAPQKNCYFYRLIGWTDEWILAGNKTSVSFGKLPPGQYVFEVRGTDSAGKPSLQTARLPLIITAPFWLNSWFYLLCIATVLAIAYLLHRYRLQQQIRQSLLIQRARSLERSWMRDKTSRDYHDQMGHQLTKISLYSELATQTLNGSNADGTMRRYLDKIAGAAERLGSDSRDFIWALNPENDSLYDLVRHLNEFATDLFSDSPIDMQCELDNNCPPNITLSMDWRRHVTLLVKEAFHNVLKHSKATRVKLEWCCKNGILRIAVVDNGVGFGINEDSAGNGLENMQQRARKLGGKLVVEAAPNVGTSVIFSAALPEGVSSSISLAEKG
ncbi:MAG: sensor histidine kinase [Calditrichia bacterium]